mmetsp:Transcript_34045/g.72401  ORF Transcript_34045/g.72401 Transcript_34045/m.72401 type:complete len:344 (+) Transcript_34045:3-1034(+)
MQRHAFLPRAAVAGFLRDDGTAVCKKLSWKADELSLYKIVLLNLPELRRLGVEYQQDLQRYEDICLTHQVLKSGGRTLKCQCFCFRASHTQQGGCYEQRVPASLRGESGAATRMDDLVAPKVFSKLAARDQQAVRDLHEWVRSKERLSEAKSRPARSGAATAPAGARRKRECDGKAEHALKKRRRRKLAGAREGEGAHREGQEARKQEEADGKEMEAAKAEPAKELAEKAVDAERAAGAEKAADAEDAADAVKADTEKVHAEKADAEKAGDERTDDEDEEADGEEAKDDEEAEGEDAEVVHGSSSDSGASSDSEGCSAHETLDAQPRTFAAVLRASTTMDLSD